MKNVILISEAYSSIHKGTSVHSESIVKSLDKFDAKFSYTLIVPKYPDSDESLYQFSHIKVIPVPVDINSEVGLLNRKARNQFISKTKSILNKFEKISIIHVLYGHYIHDAIESLNVNKVWTCHNVPPNEYPNLINSDHLFSKIINNIYFSLIKRKHKKIITKYSYDKIIAVSSFTKNELLSINSNLNVEVIGNGIKPHKGEIKNFNDKKTLKILTVGGIKSHKNIHLIPNISKSITNKFNIQWDIIGPVVDLDYFDSFKNDISEPVFFRGKVNDAELKSYFENADIYVHPSKMEGFCLTALEANLLGIPVVGTNVGAIPEIINTNKSGIVCEPTISSIISGLEYLIINYENFSSEKIQKSTINNWTWDQITNKIRCVYESYD